MFQPVYDGLTIIYTCFLSDTRISKCGRGTRWPKNRVLVNDDRVEWDDRWLTTKMIGSQPAMRKKKRVLGRLLTKIWVCRMTTQTWCQNCWWCSEEAPHAGTLGHHNASSNPTRRCPWCRRYHRRKWTQRHEFKSWTRLIAFHIALIPLGKVWIQLFSLQLWVNSWTD